MIHESAAAIQKLVKAHDAVAEQDAARLRTLGFGERGVLICSACEAAAAINRSRLGAGLPTVEPVPWPALTWEFLRKHATRVQA